MMRWRNGKRTLRVDNRKSVENNTIPLIAPRQGLIAGSNPALITKIILNVNRKAY